MKVFRKQLVWIVLEHNPDEGLIFQHTDVISDAFILFGNVKENKNSPGSSFLLTNVMVVVTVTVTTSSRQIADRCSSVVISLLPTAVCGKLHK